MIEMLMQLSYWHWLSFSVILLILELISGSSGFLLWIAIAAGLEALAMWLFPGISWDIQLLSFSALSIIAVVSWWLYLKKYPIKTDKPTLNRRGQQYVGRIFTLEAPVVNGMGKIHVDDSSWRIHCEDAFAGKRVRITGVDGVILLAKVVND